MHVAYKLRPANQSAYACAYKFCQSVLLCGQVPSAGLPALLSPCYEYCCRVHYISGRLSSAMPTYEKALFLDVRLNSGGLWVHCRLRSNHVKRPAKGSLLL